MRASSGQACHTQAALGRLLKQCWGHQDTARQPEAASGPAPGPAMLERETVGISEPLIEVIDVLFRMHSRGVIRPLVCHVDPSA